MSMFGVSKMKYILLCLLTSLFLMGCGGAGGDSIFVDKHVTCVFENGSTQTVTFHSAQYPAFAQVVPGGSTSTNPGFELVLHTKSSTETWTFTAVDGSGNTLATGTFTWDKTWGPVAST